MALFLKRKSLRTFGEKITSANRLAASVCLAVVCGYQRWVSPLLGPRCRFYPSCSEYARLSLTQFLLPYALCKILFRLLRCNPFFSGGVDYP